MNLPSASGYPAILARWNLEFRRTRPDLPAAGSPERTLSRTVVEDADGETWLLERVPTPWRHGKARIAAVLDHLRGAGLAEIAPYRRGPEGDHLIFHRQGWWQISPYVEGAPLNRPAYLRDRWRGEALAGFLRGLARAAEAVPAAPAGPRFSLHGFITDFLGQLRAKNPELWPRIGPVWEILEKSEIFEAGSPDAFGHGDLHPVNVIWGEGRIRAVIDWEFAGIKPPFYDAANLLGCLGMEKPEGLTGEMAIGFLGGLDAAGMLSAPAARTLPERTLAVRFAWLSEWLRKGDAEMVALEVAYLELLARNRDTLREEWGVSGR